MLVLQPAIANLININHTTNQARRQSTNSSMYGAPQGYIPSQYPPNGAPVISAPYGGPMAPPVYYPQQLASAPPVAYAPRPFPTSAPSGAFPPSTIIIEQFRPPVDRYVVGVSYLPFVNATSLTVAPRRASRRSVWRSSDPACNCCIHLRLL